MQHVEDLLLYRGDEKTTREFLQGDRTISAHSPKTSSLLQEGHTYSWAGQLC